MHTQDPFLPGGPSGIFRLCLLQVDERAQCTRQLCLVSSCPGRAGVPAADLAGRETLGEGVAAPRGPQRELDETLSGAPPQAEAEGTCEPPGLLGAHLLRLACVLSLETAAAVPTPLQSDPEEKPGHGPARCTCHQAIRSPRYRLWAGAAETPVSQGPCPVLSRAWRQLAQPASQAQEALGVGRASGAQNPVWSSQPLLLGLGPADHSFWPWLSPPGLSPEARPLSWVTATPALTLRPAPACPGVAARHSEALRGARVNDADFFNTWSYTYVDIYAIC